MAPVADSLSDASWALRAWWRCRHQLQRGGLGAVSLPKPPAGLADDERPVRLALGLARASCLEESLVRQSWHAAHGEPREVVIGIRGPSDAFGAHAWLEGDREMPGEFAELKRLPAPRAARSQEQVLRTARSLELDRVASGAIGALAEGRVESILLKGASFARWLYADGAVRPYGDCDLLVPARSEGAAEEALRMIGFEPSVGAGAHEDHAVARNHIWSRGDQLLELHVTLIGLQCDPEDVWAVLSEHAEEMELGDRVVRVLDPPARCLHVALHAAQHGRDEHQPLEDLRRALAVGDEAEWRAAEQLAVRLDARAALGAGLRLLPEGSALADALALPGADVVTALRAVSAPPVAFGLERLARSGGPWAKARVIASAAFPGTTFLRWWSPLARRGRLGLALAYVYRPVWLVLNLPRAYVVWQDARRGGTAS